ncbi:hypothetical protein [Chitinophaga nivalis]|uniref:Uncharacterized protein n=1 Tax=Chitinophaga nivalis TaxID=2991709 RepID=A0ABT3IWT6_9BACT|nr:hypothetical protein [Chitinophaga nivalis]MCW3461948.1 hypothetical protein [Chitinophaga nivalis]MCW3488361.1 hypothetical protein [Chitinophaga nivalis]
MNKVHTTTAITNIQAISIGQIIMDDSNYLTLWGHVQLEEVWHLCDFVTTYEVMNTMLRYGHDKHDAVQMTIVKKLENMRRIPEIIDLETELGAAVVFDNMTFCLQKPSLQPENNWEPYSDEECYYIEKVVALPPMPALPDLPPAALAGSRNSLTECISTFQHYYALYLGFIELELEEEAARMEAGLADDHLFSMAYHAWQLPASGQ